MSLDKMKARLGAISPGKLDQIYTLSKSAHAVLLDVPKLIAVCEAAQSVLSEDGVKEYLCSYVQGVELIDRLAELEK